VRQLFKRTADGSSSWGSSTLLTRAAACSCRAISSSSAIGAVDGAGIFGRDRTGAGQYGRRGNWWVRGGGRARILVILLGVCCALEACAMRSSPR